MWERPSGGIFQVSEVVARPPRRSENELSFTDADAENVRFPHHDLLVVSAMIGNHLVHRCLVNDGSSVDILYLDVLQKMRISSQSLRAGASLLHGFTGDSIFPEGSIKLALSIGEEPRRSTAMLNFMVVKDRSSYNTIIGRPTLVALKTVTSIYHQCLKFPTPRGDRVIRGNQYKAQMCYATSIRSAPADSKGKRTAGEAGLAEEAFTIGVPQVRSELDLDYRPNSN